MKGRVQALLAALLFGAGTPLAKLLLGVLPPLVLAGLLYLGAGLAATLLLLFRRGRSSSLPSSRLGPRERWALAGAVLTGGVAAPVLLLRGLAITPAATASLLLNFEAVTTAVLAAALFREAIGRRVWLGILLVTAAACLLAWRPDEPWGVSLGVLGVLGACVLWGVDNNLTRLVSAADPLVLVGIKGWAAGGFSLMLGLVSGAKFPSLGVAAAAALLGSVSYGWSIALFVQALRELGAARTGALFGTAPFAGAVLSWVLLRETAGGSVLLSLPLMIAGAFLILAESHRHLHHHGAIVHEHGHRHDDGHHDHVHEAEEILLSGSHTHRHEHDSVTHEHPHAPDLHHRHGHRKKSTPG